MDEHTFHNVLIFSGLDSEEIAKFATIAREKSVRGGEVVFSLGSEAEYFYLIKEGKIELLFPLQILGTVKDICMLTKTRGDVISWSALVPPHKYTLSARAAIDTILIAYNRSDLRLLFEKDLRVGYLFMCNLAKIVGERLQRIEIMFALEAQRMVKEKYGEYGES